MKHWKVFDRFIEYVASRKLARFYPLILGGLIVLYFLAFLVFEVPIFVFVPVVVAGWFYYVAGGVIAGVLALAVNLVLVNAFVETIQWSLFSRLENGFLVGHIFVIITGIGIGYLRESIEGRDQIYRQLSSRERLLTLLNLATRDILKMKNLEDVYYHLLTYLTNLFVADYACLAVWDEARQQVVLTAATQPSVTPFSPIVLPPGEMEMVTSVLESGHILIIDDVQKPPYAGASSLFGRFQIPTRSALIVPLIAKEYRFGAVILAFCSSRRFDRMEMAYIEYTSGQITLALRSIQQEVKIEKQLKEANALANIERALSIGQQMGVEPVLQLIVDSAKELISRSKHVVLHLLDDERSLLIPRAVAGYIEGPKTNLNMHLGEGAAGQVMATGRVITIEDIRTDPRFISQSQPVSYRSLLVSPIKINDRCVGTLSIHSDEAGIFGEDEIKILDALGTQAAIAFENANLLETTRQDYKELSAVYHLTRNLAASLEPEQLLKDTVEFLEQAFGIYQIQIFTFDADNTHLVARYGAGVVGNQLAEQSFSLSIGEGIVGHVASTGEPFFTDDVTQVAFYVSHPLLQEAKLEMALPIKVDGRVWGVMDIQGEASNPISVRHMKLMGAVTHQLAVALQKATLYSELRAALEQEKMTRSQLIRSERLAVIGRLLASVSHELNNPLQAIQNALFLLKSEESLSPQGYQDLDVILAETERMATLIGRLRTTYRSPQAEEFVELHLNTIIEDVHALTATFMRHRRINFKFSPDPNLPVILGIPDQIRQVILNLFINAMEAMSMDGKLTVITQGFPEQEQVMFSVTDTGPGIAAEILPNIFEPFVTDKNSGTGLGLTITRDIIHQHRGEIRAENNEPCGATFTVWLPMERQEQA